jgi:hypothetical protein
VTALFEVTIPSHVLLFVHPLSFRFRGLYEENSSSAKPWSPNQVMLRIKSCKQARWKRVGGHDSDDEAYRDVEGRN